MNLDVDEIVAAFKAGTLTDKIFGHEFVGSEDFLAACVKAHNDQKIDLLSLARSPNLDAIGINSFFSGQQFFCGAIPDLEGSVDDLMLCVDHLVKKGGDDGAAGLPRLAFQKWCGKDAARSQSVVHAARLGSELAKGVLAFALTGAELVDEAKSLAREGAADVQLPAIAALGRMQHSNQKTARDLLPFLLELLKATPHDGRCASVLKAAMDIAGYIGQIQAKEVCEIIERVTKAPGPTTLFYCAESIIRHGKNLNSEQMASLLTALRSIDPKHKGTLLELDVALAQLIDTLHEERAVQATQDLLISADGAIVLSDLSMLGHKISQNKHLLCSILVRWLLTGNRNLCSGLSELLQRFGKKSKGLEVHIDSLGLNEREQIFLCHKAIGYFFFQPIVAASVLLSVMREGNEKAVRAVQKLLWNPLLLNYGGSVREYLDAVGPEDKAYPRVQEVLAWAREYLDGLNSVGSIKELQPSEHHRQIERLRMYDEVSAAQKEAQKKSVLLSLVRRSVLLYGRRSLTYVDMPNDQSKFVGMELKEHSVTMEFPRMEVVDPIGLNYLIRVFRVGKLKK